MWLLTPVLSAVLLVQPSPTSAASGSFSILSFNVAGLPQFLQENGESGDKTTNTMIIGQDFAKYGYDVIHVQEDFNYHSTLYANDNHAYRTPTSGGVPFGSGLNTLSNFPYTTFTRIKWATCSDASEFDCLIPKGFSYMRMTLPSNGPTIDFYNLHADAGTETADNTARAANLQQVADYIGTHSQGYPVLIYGDTNARYTRASDTVRIFRTQAGLQDAWVQLKMGGVEPVQGGAADACGNPAATDTCEVVDKVLWVDIPLFHSRWLFFSHLYHSHFSSSPMSTNETSVLMKFSYRGNSSVTLTATTFEYVGNMFLQPNGSTLSDHNPVDVNFTWTI